MRIGLAHPYTWPAVRRGGERYLADLADWLRGAGHDVEVVTGHRLPPRVQRRLRLGDLDAFGLAAFPALRRGRFDLVHALVPAAALAARATGTPTVYTALGLPSADSPGSRQTFRAAVRVASAVTALSHPAATGLTALTGRRPLVVPPGTRVEAFPLQPEPRGGPPRLLFCSDAADPRKGLAVLLAALPAVLGRHPDARLVLAGPGDPSPALAAAPQAARAATDVVDPADERGLPARYAASTVTVLPSRAEAFGLVLVESLATGTPVVASAEGGPLEIVEPGTGFLAAPGDPADLARALTEAIALAARPGTPQRCHDHARRWSWGDRVGPAHEAVYRVALSR